jgi:hypothetical protein
MAKERKTIEQALGKKMHEISIQQDVVQRENKLLKKLNDEANVLDEELKKLDG